MQWNDEIIGLWPTSILRSEVDEPSVLRRLEELDASQASAGGDELFESEDTAIRHFRETVVEAVEAYFQHVGADAAPGWRLQGRFESLAYGESRALRNSPAAYLSGLLYIRTPKDIEALHLRKDNYPGCLTLIDPRPGFNMLSIKDDPYRNQALMVDPQPGLFLMWPAFVSHYRHPNLSRTEQLCIRFDVVPSDENAESSRSSVPFEGHFHDTWSTGLIKRRLPEHEQYNRKLIGVIDELERENADLTTDFDATRFQDIDHPAVKWLFSSINQSLTLYFKQMGMNYPISWDVASWANVNRFGDYHSPHNHPWCYLSGTYYVQVPEPEIETGGNEELNPACISYYDPRAGVHADMFSRGSGAGRVYTIKPVPGALLMWPSSVYHFVHPNLSTNKRYSISFNIHLQWRDHYL